MLFGASASYKYLSLYSINIPHLGVPSVSRVHASLYTCSMPFRVMNGCSILYIYVVCVYIYMYKVLGGPLPRKVQLECHIMDFLGWPYASALKLWHTQNPHCGVHCE